VADDLPPELLADLRAALGFRRDQGMGPGRIQVEIHDNGQGVARRWVITHQQVGQPASNNRLTKRPA
jgi:hypothetical protein